MNGNYLAPGSPKQLRSRTPPPPSAASLLSAPGTSYKALRDKDKSPRRAPRSPNATLLERVARRPKLVVAAVGACCVLWAIWHTFAIADTIVLMRFKMRDRAYEEGWIKGCGMRKRPLLFIRGDAELAVVWEMNCPQEMSLAWGAEELVREAGWWRGREGSVKKWEEAKVKRVKVPDETDTHFVYQAVLKGLEGGTTYAYSISSTPEHDEGSSTASKPTLMARHSFPWLGISTSASKIHVAAVADNQFNVRTFHRVLRALLSFSTKRTSLHAPPTLLLHAGDQVQNPDNLAQWQTDFFEPLTSFLPTDFGQSTPILLARGNHDWDATGVNAYVGGTPPRTSWMAKNNLKPSRTPHRGTYMSFSPHRRCRILVLDSNLSEEEQGEQEQWLQWELKRDEWKQATLRIVMVHVPPFLEYWDRKAWVDGKESEWSIFVRQRLTPLLARAGASLVLSGHQHAYSRGFLPTALHIPFTSAANSSSLPPLAFAAAAERGWQKAAPQQREDGTVYATFGGAGGTLDEDLVENWGFYESSVKGKYHFVSIEMEFGIEEKARRKGRKVYRLGGGRSCPPDRPLVVDVLEWKALGIDGKVFDEFRMENEGCSPRTVAAE
ncbi:Metallo-dependent phosphatase [Pseudohyphozyma bogoriensis]|nr:Metallo-dependent phosphatase [Pseudohyphozyma bogoriensis]